MARSLTLLLVLSGLLLGGCSWWSSEEEIEPAALHSFEAEKRVVTLWSSRPGGSLGEKYEQYQPAVLGGRIYVVDGEGTLSALDRESGKPIWKQATGVAVSGGVGVGDGKVILTGYAGQVLAFSALDGAALWQARLTSEAVVPVQVNDQIALVQTIDGQVTAFDAASGEERWVYRTQVPALTLRGTSTPLLTDQVSYAGFASGKVVALSNRDGELLWESRVAVPQGKTELERMVDIDGALLASESALIVTSYQGNLAALLRRDGRPIWSREVSSYQGAAEGPTDIFVSDDRGDVLAYGKSDSGEVWRQEALSFRQLSAPAVLKDTVAVADYQGYVHFMDARDGHFVARTRVDSAGVRGPLVVRDDVLYVLGNSGRLSALTIE